MPPAEVSVFIDPDGSVTFSDLPADLAEVVLALDPQAAPACPVSKRINFINRKSDNRCSTRKPRYFFMTRIRKFRKSFLKYKLNLRNKFLYYILHNVRAKKHC